MKTTSLKNEDDIKKRRRNKNEDAIKQQKGLKKKRIQHPKTKTTSKTKMK